MVTNDERWFSFLSLLFVPCFKSVLVFNRYKLGAKSMWLKKLTLCKAENVSLKNIATAIKYQYRASETGQRERTRTNCRNNDAVSDNSMQCRKGFKAAKNTYKRK